MTPSARRPAAVGAVLLAGAATLNSGLLLAEARWRALSRVAGPRAWGTHLVATGVAWAVALGAVARGGRRVRWPLPGGRGRWRSLGWGSALAGVTLVVAAGRALGPAATLNGAFFGRAGERESVKGGVYRVLRHPMYDGFALLLAAAGFLTGNGLHLAFGAECWLLCRFLEGPVEDRAWSLYRAGAGNGPGGVGAPHSGGAGIQGTRRGERS